MASPLVPIHHPTHLPTQAKRPVPTTISKSRVELDRAMRSLNSDRVTKDRDFYNSLASLCVSEKALDEGNRLRTHLSSTGCEPGLFVNNQFLNLYMKCRQVEAARKLFDEMPERNVVSWNAMISGYCSNGFPLDALSLLGSMVEVGVELTTPTYLGALQACGAAGVMRCGEGVHARIAKDGFAGDVRVANALVSMYSRFGCVDLAMMVFENILDRDVVSWNSIISAIAQNGCGDETVPMFVEMMEEGFEPNEFTFGSILGSDEVSFVTELHAQIVKRGLVDKVFIACTLVNAYGGCGHPEEAYLVFAKMPERNTVAWNSMIAVFIDNEMVEDGLRLFVEMGQRGVFPDLFTISSLLKASSTKFVIAEAMQFHGLAIKLGIYAEASIGNALITMYAKHGLPLESLQAFRSILNTDIISWNSLMQSYIQNERYEEALNLLHEMLCSGTVDDFSFVGALTACTSLGWTEIGRQVHGSFIKTGAVLNEFIGSALIDMYARSASLDDAKIAFDQIESKDLIVWNSILVSFAQNCCLDQMFLYLSMMREENFKPDMFTFTGLLSGCADASTLYIGRQIHALLLKSEIFADVAVANSLITMYSNCGSITEAETVFAKLEGKNSTTWTTMIGGYARTGCFRKAVELFEQMESFGLKPNSKTLLSLLTACSYTGMITEAESYLSSMESKYGIKPEFEHFACMVDALSRAGRLEEAEYLINNMPYEANALVWQMLLSACRLHGDLERGRKYMEKIIALEPGDSGAYVLLSNICAVLGRWEEVEEIRQLMRENGVQKVTGKSWIEVQESVHEFRAGDHSHPQTVEIYSILDELTCLMMDVS